MKKIWLATFFILFSFFSVSSAATPGEVSAQRFVLDNGLTVLISEMPGSPTVSVFALVKTGSAVEGKYLGTGISHFLEHMLFKGTAKRSTGQIAGEVQALGGQINASTSFDYTIYTLTVPQTAFDQGLDIISDMLMNSKFDAAEIEKEREVVYGEMRLYKDRPERYLSQMVFDTAYKQHPYSTPIIGYEDLLRSLTRDDFFNYYRERYVPNNIILSIAGNVRADEVLPKIKTVFQNFARQAVFTRNLAPEPQQINMREKEEEYDTDLTRVSMAYAGVSLRDNDLFALDVFAMILGQGESSRLHKELFLKRNLVRSVTASNFTPLDRGIFEIEMVLDQNNLATASAAVKEQIALIAHAGVDPKELEKVKQQIRAQHVFSRLTSDVVANSAAADEAFTGDSDFSRKYVDAVKKVTVDDIKRVAKLYFQDEQLSMVVLKPKQDPKESDKQKEATKLADIEKIVLDNGLTILLRENHSFPIVSVNLAINGGIWQESMEKGGLCELTSRLLVAGTKSRSAESIAESLESRGASLVPFSGRNSFGLMFNFLSEDTGFAIDLVEDFIKNPIFAQAEIEREKNKILTALISQEDSISTVTSRNLRETLFTTHPYRRDGLGTKESIGNISRQDIVDFYQTYVIPNNMVLSVFGDIDRGKLVDALKKKFGVLKKQTVNLATYEEKSPDATREKTIYLNKKQAMVMIGFQGANLYSRDRDGLQVLSAILGSSFNGRIFVKIRDEFGQAYTLGGGFTPSRDMGMLTFYVLTNEESVGKVKDALVQILKEIGEKGVSEKELAEIKTYLKGSWQMDIQTDSALGFTVCLDELYGTGYDYYLSFEKRIDAVTADDVKRLAVQYLDLNKAAIVVARPAQQAPVAP